MKILFISHSYPPVVGGIENENYHLSQGLKKHAEVSIVANGKGKHHLPVFLVAAFFRAFLLMRTHDVCYGGSGVVAPLVLLLKLLHPGRLFICQIHGLDIVFAFKKGLLPRIYKLVNISALKKLDRIFAISSATVEEAARAGISPEICIFAPLGVDPLQLRAKHAKEDLSRVLGKDIGGRRVVLRLARFVHHKGTDWFIRNVMPRLPEEIVFVAAGHRVGSTAGDSDNFLECERAVTENRLEERVWLLPSIGGDTLKVLLNTADLVVSPNIRVPGSMEGFGLNVIEAGACGRPVMASDLDGLADAVAEGENGFLVDPGNAGAWVDRIEEFFVLSEDARKEIGERTAKYVEENCTWDKTCQRYFEHIQKSVETLRAGGERA